MAQWWNPLTLQPEQSGGVGSMPRRALSLEHHDKGSHTKGKLLIFILGTIRFIVMAKKQTVGMKTMPFHHKIAVS